jgi:hypothetical protein
MGEWFLPSLFQVLAQEESLPGVMLDGSTIAQRQLRAERQWAGAITALELLLSQTPLPSQAPHQTDQPAGLLFSGPSPVLCQADLVQRFKSWTFTVDQAAQVLQLPFQLPAMLDAIWHGGGAGRTLPLFPQDPLAAEQFCLVMTETFGLVLVLGRDEQGEPRFAYSFVPDVIDRVWQLLRLRVVMLRPQQSELLDELMDKFTPKLPDYRLVSQFSQLLLNCLPDGPANAVSLSTQDLAAAVTQVAMRELDPVDEPDESNLDVELLQAIAHEVRTPLTTIRMLTRLLLKRKDMAPDAIKRLQSIDRECSEQIDRFGFIFRAVEMETSDSQGMALTVTCLDQVFAQSIPRWQQQAQQRGLILDVTLPSHMPAVVTDPALLDQSLGSLIDRAARSLPSGSTIQVEVAIAGHQLKLQVQSNLADNCHAAKPLIKSLGQMLMFQPETGNLSLNLAVTKNLFRAMGGKMTVRQRSAQDDEVYTIFLPIESRRS